MIGLMMLIAVAAYVGIAWFVVKRLPGQKAKWIAVAVFVLIPTLDEILGQVYFRHLCEAEAGVKVYQTVELPAAYWDEQGRAKFYDEKNGNFHLSKDYPTELKIEKNYSIFHIDRLVVLLQDQKKEQVFAERISHMYWGGWMRRNLSPHNSATSCSNDLEQYGNFIRQVFKPASAK